MKTIRICLIILVLLALPAGSVAAQIWLELRAGTYQEHHPYLEYHGNWQAFTNESYIEDAAIFTTDPHAWVRFTMRGRTATLYRTVGPGLGTFEVCVNNNACSTISNESMVTTNRMPVVLFSEYVNGSTTITLRAAGGTLSLDQLKIDATPDSWPIPTPWPTPNATPFMNTWDEGTELALHMVNGWIWLNQNRIGPDDNSIQIFDMIAFGVMLGAIFVVLASAIQRAMNGGRKRK